MIHHLLLAEPLWILALAPLLLFPGRIVSPEHHWMAVAGLFAFWPIRLAATGRLSIPTPVNLCLTLLLLWLPATFWASINLQRSWEAAGYLLFGVVLAIALINWPPTQKRPEAIAWGLLALAVGLSLAGPLLLSDASIASMAGGLFAPLLSLVNPVTTYLGETINPNVLANALLVIAPLAIALALRLDWTRRRWLPPSFGLLAFWLAALIAMTQSRGSVIALAVALILLLALRWPRLIYLLPALLAAVAVVIYVGDADLLDQLFSSTAVGGLDERIEIWQRAVYAIHDFPFTGVGLGAFNLVVPLLYPYYLIPPGVDIPDAHNTLLQVGVDLGVPGLIAYLALLMCLFAMLVGLLRRHDDALIWTLSAGLLGSFIALLVGGVFAAVNWGVKLAFVNWLLVALAVLLHRGAYEKTP